MLVIVGCDSAPVLEQAIKENEPKTRALYPLGVRESEIGGILTEPDLEYGDVLYIKKKYSFSYSPEGVTIPDHPYVGFNEVAIGIRRKPSTHPNSFDPEYKIKQKIPIYMDHTFIEPGLYEVKGNTQFNWLHGKEVAHASSEFYQSKIYTVVDPFPISGSNRLVVFENATYSVPTPIPPGVTFSGWTPIPNAASNNWKNPNLTVMFISAGTYILTASLKLPDGTNYIVNKKITVHESNLTNLIINGPHPTPLNTEVSYTIPTPAGVTFNGWEITPGDYTCTETNGTFRRSLNITFSSFGEYTITANFTLPGGRSYSTSKTVSVRGAVQPRISYELYFESSSLSAPVPKEFAAQAIPTHPVDYVVSWAKIYVIDPPGYLEYQWKINGNLWDWEWYTDPSTRYPTPLRSVVLLATERHFNLYNIPANVEYEVSCRTRFGNDVSEWSNTLVVSQIGVSYPLKN